MRVLVYALCAVFALTSPATAASGVASYYGGSDGLCGKKTASGQRLDCRAMTAAHRTLPLGTKVRVRHHNKEVVVTINDRGPAAWTRRVLDLGLGAARALGMSGTGRVDYEVVN